LVLQLLALLTGKPSFHGELLGTLKEGNTLLVGHYGAGASSLAALADDISFERDRCSGMTVSVVFHVRRGPVAFVSLTGRGGSYRMLVAAGESIQAKEVFLGGVVANVRLRVPHEGALAKARGMSHHWVLGIGDVTKELVEYCDMTGIRPVVI
jgi:L-arabinose isomerase